MYSLLYVPNIQKLADHFCFTCGKFKFIVTCEILGSHSGVVEGLILPRYDAVYNGV